MVNFEVLEKTLKIKLLDHQKEWLSEICRRDFLQFRGPRASGKTYTLALYTIIALSEVFGRNRVIVTSPVFRNTKLIAEIVNSLMSKVHLRYDYQLILNSDKVTIKFGENTAYFLPIGNGEKIRGMRGNIILVDNRHYVDDKIIDLIYSGLAAVSSDPFSTSKYSTIEYKIIEATDE